MEEKPMPSILDHFKEICPEVYLRSESGVKDQEDLKYMDVMIAITLKFIKVQYHDEMDDKTSQRNILTINASACEFMELLLKQISTDKFKKESNEIAHQIISQLIDSFKDVISRNDQAMQVNIINLVGLILKITTFEKQNLAEDFKNLTAYVDGGM